MRGEALYTVLAGVVRRVGQVAQAQILAVGSQVQLPAHRTKPAIGSLGTGGRRRFVGDEALQQHQPTPAGTGAGIPCGGTCNTPRLGRAVNQSKRTGGPWWIRCSITPSSASSRIGVLSSGGPNDSTPILDDAELRSEEHT